MSTINFGLMISEEPHPCDNCGKDDHLLVLLGDCTSLDLITIGHVDEGSRFIQAFFCRSCSLNAVNTSYDMLERYKTIGEV